MKPIKLHRDEKIIAVVPERCSGPGWSNAPIWVYISQAGDKLRMECIQPDERTPELHTLFGIGESACTALVNAVPVKRSKEYSSAVKALSGEAPK